MNEIEDRNEGVGLIEPLLIGEFSKYRAELNELAFELAMRSTRLKSSLPSGIISALSKLVRSMNCYYSNLIEGHDTHPVDIERALNGDYSSDPEKRNLQLEARAHIAVQTWIDESGLEDRALTISGIKEIHKRFYELLPDHLLELHDPQTNKPIRVLPGEFRIHDVKVGRHIAISPGSIPRLLNRFEEAYSNISKTDMILASASAHHRLLYIHPFLDGNGRVARLMSYAILLQVLDTGGIWSIASGLARNDATYKGKLADCDLPRRNDLDGRGHLSEEALAAFTKFFLQTCIDQVNFMESLVQPEKLHSRIIRWVEDEMKRGMLPPHSNEIIQGLLYRGSLERGDIVKMLGKTQRHARRITSELLKKGIITSENTRTPFYLAFPASLASEWMPGLFPAKTGNL